MGAGFGKRAAYGIVVPVLSSTRCSNKRRVTSPSAAPSCCTPVHWCRRYVEAGAPNTDVLRDPTTGKMKELVKVLMVDTLPKNESEVAACYVRMEEMGIRPYQRRGGAFDLGDGCHVFPPSPAMKKLAEAYFREGRGGDGGGVAPTRAVAAGHVASGPLNGGSGVAPRKPFRLPLPLVRHVATRMPAERPTTRRL